MQNLHKTDMLLQIIESFITEDLTSKRSWTRTG